MFARVLRFRLSVLLVCVHRVLVFVVLRVCAAHVCFCVGLCLYFCVCVFSVWLCSCVIVCVWLWVCLFVCGLFGVVVSTVCYECVRVIWGVCSVYVFVCVCV